MPPKAKPTKATSDAVSQEAAAVPGRQQRKKLSQSDVPAYTLEEALRIPEVLRDQYAKAPTLPLDVAKAMDVSPTTGSFRMLTGAAVAYGLTEGGGQAQMISLTSLGRRIVAPTEEGGDLKAMREAILKPRVIREFLEKYDGSSIPTEPIALNVIEGLGVPPGSTKRALEMILANAEALGLLVEIKGKRYVRLDSPATVPSSPPADENTSDKMESDEQYDVDEAPAIAHHRPTPSDVNSSRVFITHGRNAKIVEQIRKILVFGKFEPVLSVDRQTVAKPVPDKVMDDMRACGAAIVHVGQEQKLLDSEGNEQIIINQNVLIEIGAAMALYGRRFILLVERGVKLPSNLQGLYEVRYEGDQLDHDATMKLLEAFNEFR